MNHNNPDYCRAVLRAAERGTGLRFSQIVTTNLTARDVLSPENLPQIHTKAETRAEFGTFSGPPGPGETILTAEEVKAEEPDCWAALQG